MSALLEMLSPDMMHSFAALLLAHVLADFVLQPNAMVTRKADPPVFLIHILIVFALSNAALGGAWQAAAVVSLAHLGIDAIKIWGVPSTHRNSFLAFFLDQLAHLGSLILAVLWWPDAAGTGIWGPYMAMIVGPALVISGAIFSIIAGGYAVGLLTARFQEHLSEDSLPDAGRMIGQLERALIFLLVWVGEPAGVGFLVAAKSILRFDAARETKAGEYVIIGTLASFAWALSIAYATTSLLEIATRTP